MDAVAFVGEAAGPSNRAQSVPRFPPGEWGAKRRDLGSWAGGDSYTLSFSAQAGGTALSTRLTAVRGLAPDRPLPVSTLTRTDDFGFMAARGAGDLGPGGRQSEGRAIWQRGAFMRLARRPGKYTGAPSRTRRRLSIWKAAFLGAAPERECTNFPLRLAKPAAMRYDKSICTKGMRQFRCWAGKCGSTPSRAG